MSFLSSLKDGMIRIADKKDRKHVKADIILNAERRGTGAATITDHGNMYGQEQLAFVCKTFGIKHIPGCEFYMATDGRFDKNYSNRGSAYMHIMGQEPAGIRQHVHAPVLVIQ